MSKISTGIKSGSEEFRDFEILRLMIRYGLMNYYFEKPILTIRSDGDFKSINDMMLHQSVNLMSEETVPLKAGGINWSNVGGQIVSSGKMELSTVGTYGTFNVMNSIRQQTLMNFPIFRVGAALRERIDIQKFLLMSKEEKEALLRYDRNLTLEEVEKLLKEILEVDVKESFGAIVTTEQVSTQELAHIYSSTGLPIYIGRKGNLITNPKDPGYYTDVTAERCENIKQSLGTSKAEYFEDESTGARVICIGRHH